MRPVRLDSLRNLSCLLVKDFIIPQQVDQRHPSIKEFRFDGGELGLPPRVGALDLRGNMDSGAPWEIAEFEVFGRGYASEASLVSEIIALGQSRPVVHRFFDTAAPTRPVVFESFTTRDVDGDRQIDTDELAQSVLAQQVDLDAPGQPVLLGKVRWRLQVDGPGAQAHLRIRSGMSPHTRIYQRGTTPDSRSPCVDESILHDWPSPGTRLDAFSYAALSPVQRAQFTSLPANGFDPGDGFRGGWTPWSTPIELVPTVGGQSTAVATLPIHLPLSRYVQSRVDCRTDEDSGTALDFVELDYGPPIASRGIVAQITPTQAQLGVASVYTYMLLPEFDSPT